MRIKTGHKIIAGIIAFICLWFYADYQSKKPQPISKEKIEQISKESAAYDSLKRETSGNFLYMRNSIFNHRDKSNNISAYIKYNYTSKKPYLFMKISCCTWVTQTYAIFLKADNDFIDIDYINDVYPLDIQVGNGKMYGVLDIQIGETLTEFLWKIARSTNASIKFVGASESKEFPISDKEKEALEQVLLGFNHFFN